ncbi:MAG TPA: HTTM domain-containing protein [Saprospirales bacterium]|nr:HTTM domain-containing protein [Saprospirales bacterium]
MTHQLRSWLTQPVGIAPLATLRVVLGAMLVFSTVRFMALGWVDDHYLCPDFHFKYYGFEWVGPLPGWAMYGVHGLLILSSLCVMLGLYYRLAAVMQFLLFTYTELIDLTYYLNHYYFVSLVCLLLIVVPANRAYSLDVYRHPALHLTQVPRWTIFIFQWQLGIVYFYAGIWKINYDWLVNALPLRIWVPANDQIPLIGWLFKAPVTPWLFAWIGMLYDVSIVFWLSWARTRVWAYLTVIVFHTLTGLMFQIGVFPLVMIGATLIFFSEQWHVRLWHDERWTMIPWNDERWTMIRRALRPVFRSIAMNNAYRSIVHRPSFPIVHRPSFIVPSFLFLFFTFQLLFPWRYLLYPGNIFWTEEGYRFCFRVMLMEKAGTATFFVKDARTGREGEVVNSDFLNPHQEKQMAMQPDMILQFAHFLKQYYTTQGLTDPSVRAEVYVTLNGRPSQLLIDPKVDLTKIRDGWSHKTCITAYSPQ